MTGAQFIGEVFNTGSPYMTNYPDRNYPVVERLISIDIGSACPAGELATVPQRRLIRVIPYGE